MASSDLKEITRLLVDEFHPLKIILFGSHAWGAPNASSDVDIMVIVEDSDENPVKRDMRARRRLRDIDVPMDIIVKTRAEFDAFAGVKASLERAVLERGKLLYG